MGHPVELEAQVCFQLQSGISNLAEFFTNFTLFWLGAEIMVVWINVSWCGMSETELREDLICDHEIYFAGVEDPVFGQFRIQGSANRTKGDFKILLNEYFRWF